MRNTVLYVGAIVVIYVGFLFVSYRYQQGVDAANTRYKIASLKLCVSNVNQAHYEASARLQAISDCYGEQ